MFIFFLRKDVIECLSKRVRDDVLQDDKPQVSRGCRQQLRQQISQRHENIKFDPILREKCRMDIKNLCGSVTEGQGKVNF